MNNSEAENWKQIPFFTVFNKNGNKSLSVGTPLLYSPSKKPIVLVFMFTKRRSFSGGSSPYPMHYSWPNCGWPSQVYLGEFCWGKVTEKTVVPSIVSLGLWHWTVVEHVLRGRSPDLSLSGRVCTDWIQLGCFWHIFGFVSVVRSFGVLVTDCLPMPGKANMFCQSLNWNMISWVWTKRLWYVLFF